MRKSILDRKQARRIKDIPGMTQIMIDLKPNRSVSDVYINQDIDVTNLCKYIEKKKKTNEEITFFHAFVTGIGKVFYNRPYMNRFVSNRHVYEHNDVTISFVAKVSFDDKAEEMMIIIKIEEDDNLNTICNKIKEKVNKIRNNKEVIKGGANAAIDVLGKLPNIIRIPIVGLFKWCDKKGILPGFLIEDNLYYSSIILSNLGTLHCGAIFHNITDFGNASSIATIGEIKEKEVIINGKKEIRKFCEFGINLDERIADGYYFIKSLQLLQYIYDNPELLEDRADEKVEIKK